MATRVKPLSLYTAKAVRLGHAAAIIETPRLRGRARQTRNAALAWKNPLCVECEKIGRVSAVDEWDHVTPLADGGDDDPSNLQGLCHEHHAAKTSAEAMRRTSGVVGST